jgi:hypothetical protein
MIIKSTNQLTLGDVFKRVECDDREWAVVIGFSNRKHIKARKTAPFYNGLEVIIAPRARIRWQVKEPSDE